MLGDVVSRIQHGEKIGRAWALQEQAGVKPIAPVSRPISSVAKPMKETMAPMLACAAQMQHRADHENGDDGDGAGGRGHDAQHRPPVQHRKLLLASTMSPVARNFGLGRQPGEGLHDQHIGQRILRRAGEGGVVALDLALRGLGSADDQDGEGAEHHDQHDQRDGELPVEDDGERQQHDGGEQSGEMLAEKGQPHPEQPIRAGEHHFHQPAGLAVAVEGGREREHVAEESAPWRQPVAVREALGLHGQQDIGADADQADAGPDDQQHLRAMDDGFVGHVSRRVSRLMTRPNSTGSANWNPMTARLAMTRPIAMPRSGRNRPSTRA